MAKKRRSTDELKKIDALIERLREFVRLNYVTAAEAARQISVNDSTVYSWLLGQTRDDEEFTEGPHPIPASAEQLF